MNICFYSEKKTIQSVQQSFFSTNNEQAVISAYNKGGVFNYSRKDKVHHSLWLICASI